MTSEEKCKSNSRGLIGWCFGYIVQWQYVLRIYVLTLLCLPLTLTSLFFFVFVLFFFTILSHFHLFQGSRHFYQIFSPSLFSLAVQSVLSRNSSVSENRRTPHTTTFWSGVDKLLRIFLCRDKIQDWSIFKKWTTTFSLKQDMFRSFNDHLQLWIRFTSSVELEQAMAYK